MPVGDGASSSTATSIISADVLLSEVSAAVDTAATPSGSRLESHDQPAVAAASARCRLRAMLPSCSVREPG